MSERTGGGGASQAMFVSHLQRLRQLPEGLGLLLVLLLLAALLLGAVVGAVSGVLLHRLQPGLQRHKDHHVSRDL